MPMVLAAAVGGCHGKSQARKPRATPVRVASAARIDAPIDIIASGVVEPMQTVSVTAQVSGTLQDVLFREGDFVQAGQVLFRIDPRPLQAQLDQARATLARDEAQADAGRKDDLRYQVLVAKGYVTRSQADQIHATALAQQATVEADRAVLRAAAVNLGYATVRAPISGRTGSLLVRRGNVVSPGGGPLLVINQLNPVLVRFPISDQDFPSVQRAVATHPLQVVAVASDSMQSSEHGQLSFLDNAIDSLTGSVTGKATFPNLGRHMWPGQLVFLTIQLSVQRNVLAVPTPAVLTGQEGGSYVYVVDAKGTAQTRNVATGQQVGDLTVVTSGLADGERVVVDGQSRLNPGSRVALVGGGSDTTRGNLQELNGGAGAATGAGAGAGTAAGEVSNASGAVGGGTVGGRSGGGGGGRGAPEGVGAARTGAGTAAGGSAAQPALRMQPAAPSTGAVSTPGTSAPASGAAPAPAAPTMNAAPAATPATVAPTSTTPGRSPAAAAPRTSTPATTTPATGGARPATTTGARPGRP